MALINYPQVAGLILAGGVSSRMGQDKGLLDFGGVPLLLHTAQLIEPLVSSIMIVGSPGRYSSLGLRVIDDTFRESHNQSGAGPLAGIAVALAATHSPWNLILACDMPYLSAEWLNWLLTRAVLSSAEAVIPQTEHGLQPLAAVYRRECGPKIVSVLARGVRRVTEAVEELRLELVYPHDWQAVDPAGLVLKNMNAPEDYKEALIWKKTGKLPS